MYLSGPATIRQAFTPVTGQQRRHVVRYTDDCRRALLVVAARRVLSIADEPGSRRPDRAERTARRTGALPGRVSQYAGGRPETATRYRCWEKIVKTYRLDTEMSSIQQ